MGLQDVKKEILEDAKKEAEKLQKEAKDREDEIIEKAENKAKSIQKEAKEEIKDKKESERQKTVSSAKMKARKQKLQAKQEKIDEAFDEFKSDLENLDEEERKEFLENSIEDAEFNVAKIEVSSDFEPAVDERKHDVIENNEINGFILNSEDGQRSKNYSIDKIMQMYKDKHRKKVAKILFED